VDADWPANRVPRATSVCNPPPLLRNELLHTLAPLLSICCGPFGAQHAGQAGGTHRFPHVNRPRPSCSLPGRSIAGSERMRPLPSHPAVPGPRGNALGQPRRVVGASKVAELRRRLRCPRCEGPQPPPRTPLSSFREAAGTPPAAASSFRGSPGAGPLRSPARESRAVLAPAQGTPTRVVSPFLPNLIHPELPVFPPAKAAVLPHPPRHPRFEGRLAQIPHLAPARDASDAPAPAHGSCYESG
jgi:hypothetical protein